VPAAIATRPLRIAQVAPLYESVPPALYGGTERIVHYLTEALVELGHDVTLFASGDSCSSARLIAPCARALRLDNVVDPLAYHYTMLESVYRRAHEFDLVHFHLDYLHFPTTRRLQIKNVTTLHGRLDMPELGPLYAEYSEMPVVSISRAQRAPLPEACWVGNVYHGLPLDLQVPGPGGDYLAFLGRVSPEKGLERAIDIAERTGMLLRIAAKVDRADRAYYEDRIKPRLGSPHVEFIGEIDEAGKRDFLGNARALVFPIDWPEPFGLVMIEAMACGTPTIAWRNGSVPEVLDDGVTGTIVSSIDEAVDAVHAIGKLPRDAVRARFETRFSSLRMASDYVDLYRQLTSLGDDDARDRSGDPGLLHPGYRVARG
jgi:glycosyltransferase involved in cell wall biosynthesis